MSPRSTSLGIDHAAARARPKGRFFNVVTPRGLSIQDYSRRARGANGLSIADQLAAPTGGRARRRTLADLSGARQIGDHFVGQRLGTFLARIKH